MVFLTLLLIGVSQYLLKKYRFPWVQRAVKKYIAWLSTKWSTPNAAYGYSGVVQLLLPLILIILLVYWVFVGLLGNFGYLLLSLLIGISTIQFYQVILPNKDDQQPYQQALYHIFSLIFWFTILGPIALFFLAAILIAIEDDALQADNYVIEALKQLRGWVAWIPVRLIGLSFAFVGYFSTTMKLLITSILWSWRRNDELIVSFGKVAQETENDKHPSEHLIRYAIWLWIAVLAFMSLMLLY